MQNNQRKRRFISKNEDNEGQTIPKITKYFTTQKSVISRKQIVKEKEIIGKYALLIYVNKETKKKTKEIVQISGGLKNGEIEVIIRDNKKKIVPIASISNSNETAAEENEDKIERNNCDVDEHDQFFSIIRDEKIIIEAFTNVGKLNVYLPNIEEFYANSNSQSSNSNCIRPDILQLDKKTEAMLSRNLDQKSESRLEKNETETFKKKRFAFMERWSYCLEDWKCSEIESILLILCKITLDCSIEDGEISLIRFAINNIFDQLQNNKSKFQSIMISFATKGIIESAEGNVPRIFTIFQMLCKVEQFNKILALHAIFQWVYEFCGDIEQIDKNGSEACFVHCKSIDDLDRLRTQMPHKILIETEMPSLVDLFRLLPTAVEKVKNDRILLALIYYRFVDELTMDNNLLNKMGDNDELDKYIMQSRRALNTTKNLDHRLIEYSTRSIHRIRRIIQNRRNLFQGGLDSSDEEGGE